MYSTYLLISPLLGLFAFSHISFTAQTLSCVNRLFLNLILLFVEKPLELTFFMLEYD
jgi:hypothetical protein